MSQTRRVRRRIAHEEVGLQIAPMIDVTLLLLFFFMLSGKLTKDAKLMDVKMPTAISVTVPKDMGGRDIVNIDEKGQLYSGDLAVSEKELTAHLKERFKNFPPLKLYVRADSRTPAKRIKEVMKIAAQAGAIEVVFGVLQTGSKS